jgi:hypothetical protein
VCSLYQVSPYFFTVKKYPSQYRNTKKRLIHLGHCDASIKKTYFSWCYDWVVLPESFKTIKPATLLIIISPYRHRTMHLLYNIKLQRLRWSRCSVHSVPKFAGSNPAEAVEFLRAKKSSASLPSEGK